MGSSGAPYDGGPLQSVEEGVEAAEAAGEWSLQEDSGRLVLGHSARLESRDYQGVDNQGLAQRRHST